MSTARRTAVTCRQTMSASWQQRWTAAAAPVGPDQTGTRALTQDTTSSPTHNDIDARDRSDDTSTSTSSHRSLPFANSLPVT